MRVLSCLHAEADPEPEVRECGVAGQEVMQDLGGASYS